MKKRVIAIFIIAGLLTALTIINARTSKSQTREEFTTQEVNYTTTTQTTLITSKKVSTTKAKKTQKTTTNEGTYKLTHYGWDCKNCSGKTASGYNVRNTIYYNDSTYGILRIVAMKDLPLYSVIKIKNYDNKNIFAIVLDKGVGSGVIDLLVENEEKASKLGIRKNIEIEILRSGKK